MPAPLAGGRRTGTRLAALVEGGHQFARVQQGYEVPAVVLLGNRFRNKERDRFESHLGAELFEGTGANAIGRHFLISDDPAGNMPAQSEKFIIAPGQQGAAGVIPNQEIDVDERGDAAGEQEKFFGKPVMRIADGGFDRRDLGGQAGEAGGFGFHLELETIF